MKHVNCAVYQSIEIKTESGLINFQAQAIPQSVQGVSPGFKEDNEPALYLWVSITAFMLNLQDFIFPCRAES
ncbi:hypothetical protein J6590_091328 [Homalodisca vitripennis]|nr:hypothetical protein J6590_091328 [Homalodisca vitripennis]